MGILSFGLAPSKSVSIGINVKNYLINFVDDHNGNAVGIDLGIEYNVNHDLTLSYKIENLSSEMNWNIDVGDESRQSIESFPLYHHFGTSYSMKDLTLFVKYLGVQPISESIQHNINVGIEAKFSSIDLFCGVQQNRYLVELVETFDDLNFSFNGGFSLPLNLYGVTPLKIQYAFISGKSGEGVGHVFTLNYDL